jgi:5-methylcytosine-specific restriction endonuclease McrA
MTVTSKVLVCDAAMQPHHWVKWEDAVVLQYKNLTSHGIGDIKIYSGGISRITQQRSIIHVPSVLFLKTVLKYDSRVPPLTNQNLFARDLNICIYCGKRFKEDKLSRDHIIPVSKGGKNTWHNCATSCKSCNNMKADLPIGKAVDEDGEKMVLRYKPYIPSHVERLIMQHRHIQQDQIKFLYDMLPETSRLKTVYSYLGDI